MHYVDFSETARALENITRSRGTPFTIEAVSRLGQLHWLIDQIKDCESRAIEERHLVFEYAKTERLHPHVVGLQTLVEAFYYIAWRFVALVDRKDSPVPELSRLKILCPGICMVRNQLLEHPEGKNSGVHMPSIVFGTSRGPQLKVFSEVSTDSLGEPIFKTNNAELFDKGLWANARELKKAVDGDIVKSCG